MHGLLPTSRNAGQRPASFASVTCSTPVQLGWAGLVSGGVIGTCTCRPGLSHITYFFSEEITFHTK